MKLIIVGKAASGKDHLKARLKAKGLKCAISCTTRPARPGEVEGEDYYFVDDRQFEQMIAAGLFLEWVTFNGWYYGTLLNEFNQCDYMIMSPDGLSRVSDDDLDRAMIVYIDIDLEVRRSRLNQRQDYNDSIDRRIREDEIQFKEFNKYDLRITNSDF